MFYNISLAKSYEFIDSDKAQFFYEKILKLSDTNTYSIEMMAFFYQYKKKDFKLAEHYFLLGLKKYGNNHNFSYNIAILYQEKKIYNKAIEFFNLAKETKDNLHSIYNNLGRCFLEINKISLAILMFKKSIKEDKYLSSSYINLGALYKKLKRYKSALSIYDMGLKGVNFKEVLWQKSLLNILMGDLKNGLEFYETRLSLSKFNKFLPSLSGIKWQREDLTNKILLISTEQGFGDMIFFFRYIKYVLLLNPKKIIILAPKELEIIFNIDERIEIILENKSNIKYDYYCYIMSLAYLFYDNENLLPNKTPYLSHNNKNITINVNKNKFNIFLMWETSNGGDDGKNRNIKLSLLSSLFDIENINFYSMKDSEIKNLKINNISNHINDFNDTSIILEKMDLVLCIDTSIAHLAGALNIPCFVILPFDSNWRWGLDDNWTSNYPRTRLFRGDKKDGFRNIGLNLKVAIEDMMENGFNMNAKINNINIENIIKQRKYAQDFNNKALTCFYNKEYENSLKYSIKSMEIYKNPPAFMHIALVYLRNNKFQEALLNLKESIFLQENDEAYFHLGVCSLKLEDKEQSIKAFENSIRLNPSNVQSKHNLAFIYTQNNMNLKAIDVNISILSVDKSNIQALESLAVLFDKELDNKNAKKYYGIIASRSDSSFLAKLNMASFYFKNNQFYEARKFLLELISNNAYLEKSHQILGSIYKKEININKAIFHYEKSIEFNKNDKTLVWNLGFLYLSKGDYIKGFSFIEKRYDTNLLEKKRFLKSDKYNNEDLNNKTLYIYMEQGFGDNILLARYIKLIKKKYPKSTIYLSSRKELFLLFSNIKEIDKIFSTQDIKEDYDYHISLFSMPFIFQTTIHTIPYSFPYLEPKEKNYNLNLDNDYLNIGIVWESGENSVTKEERSIHINKFKLLSKNKKIKLFSLQKGHISSKEEKISSFYEDLSPKIKDFNDTANIILKLDLIISVDTAVAHLSGALNKKCFVILPEDTNWRWGFDGNSSPWFKSIKLFRMDSKSKKDVFIEIQKEIGDIF